MARNVTVTFDDGTTHQYAGVPDDATPDAVHTRVMQDFPDKTVAAMDGGKAAADTSNAGPPKNYDLADVPGAALSNVGSSAEKTLNSIGAMIAHPIDTAVSAGKAIVGAGENITSKAVGLVNPDLVDFTNKNIQPDSAEATADTIGQGLKDRFGGYENIKRTLATDPVGSLLDASSLAAGGEGLTRSVLPEISDTLGTASRLTNPVNLAAQGIDAATSPLVSSQKQAVMDLLKSQNLTKDATTKEVMDAGYKIPPSLINGSGATSKAVEGLSGSAKLKQAAIVANQPVTNSLAKQYLGIPNKTALNDSVMEADRYAKSAPYREAAKLPADVVGQTTTKSQGTGRMVTTDIVRSGDDILDDLMETRAKAKRYYKAADTGAHPEAFDTAQALDNHAEALENQLSTLAQKNGNTNLVDQLKVARKDVAKNWTIDRALNDATGDVDALKIGDALDKGAPLDGQALTIAKFAKGFRDVGRVPKGGDAVPLTAMDAGLATVIGAGSAAIAGIPLAYVAAPAAARLAGRYSLLSNPVQKMLSNPSYTASTPIASTAKLLNNGTTTNVIDSLYQMGRMDQGNKANLDNFKAKRGIGLEN